MLRLCNNQIDVIAKSEEKYLTFTKYMPLNNFNKRNFKIRFIDSFSFLNSSLASLAESLPSEQNYETKKYFGEHFELMSKKGIFPYEHITDIKVLDEKNIVTIVFQHVNKFKHFK